MNKDTRIYVAGHKGFVGSAITRRLIKDGYENLILKNRTEADLTEKREVDELFESTRPEVVVIAAARVGGIAANLAAPVEFLVENLQIQNNLLLACHRHGVERTVFLASSCIYPRDCPQPMREEHLLTGPFEPTNETYAVAKVAGVSLAQALNRQYGMKVVLPIPSNLYGPGDHFDFERSHVASALVRRICGAKSKHAEEVTMWGTGDPTREFLHVDDLADAVLFLVSNHDSPDVINVGSGEEISIRQLAVTISDLVGYDGLIGWDTGQPDGMPRKLMDVSKISSLGWQRSIGLEEGLHTVIEDFRSRYPSGYPNT